MKSSDKLFRAPCARLASLELHDSAREGLCVRELPALVLMASKQPMLVLSAGGDKGLAARHCMYSSVLSPTPPAAACTKQTFYPTSVRGVLQRGVRRAPRDGQRRACSNVTEGGELARKQVRRELERRAPAILSRCRMRRLRSPNASLPPTSAAMPAQSSPGGPGSPGYSPSTLSTSRKVEADRVDPEAHLSPRWGGCKWLQMGRHAQRLRRHQLVEAQLDVALAPRAWKPQSQ